MNFIISDALISDPTGNGVTDFVLGILFILSIYHLFLFFHNKDKAYLLYSSYTILIFLRHSFLAEGDLFDQVLHEAKPWFNDSGTKDFIVWFYNCVYFFFLLHFVDMKWKNNLANKIVWVLSTLLISVSVLLMLISLVLRSGNLMLQAYLYVFLPLAVFTSFIGIYAIMRSNSPVRWYALTGSLVLLAASLAATFIDMTDLGNSIFSEPNSKFNVFYVGMVIENFLFALGLGQKQRIIIKERNSNQEELIQQYEENELLRESLKLKLEAEVISISKQSEQLALEKLKAQYEQELTELRISSLRNQMNPHFIFNSLNSIKLYIINQETTNAVYYLNKFSKLIRKILATTQESSINLEEELETAELYMSIENIRFNNELNCEIVISPDVNSASIKLPPLVLQPFIENSIWHGLSMKDGMKNIWITVSPKNDGHVTITIEDNGIGRAQAAENKRKKAIKKDSIGLGLTQERMERFYKDSTNAFSMRFIDLGTIDSPAGTRIELDIPLK